jgi:hypothetical protein
MTEATTEPHQAVSAESENPYETNPQSSPSRFRGRERESARLLDVITSARGRCELHGLPGIGRTSLARFVIDPAGKLKDAQGKAMREGFSLCPVFVECSRIPPSVHPLTYVYNAARRAYDAVAARLPEHFGARPRRPPVGDGETELDALTDDAIRLANAGVRLLFVLDDWDIAFQPRCFDLTIRPQMTRLGDSAIFVLITARRPHHVNPKAAGSVFYQPIKVIWVGALSTPGEAEALVAQPAAERGYPFPETDIAFIVEQSGRHPHLLWLAARALWEFRADLGLLRKRDAPLRDFQKRVLAGRLYADFQSSFRVYWDLSDPSEREVLKAMASSSVSWSSCPYSLGALSAKGLVSAGEDGGQLFSPLFQQFVLDLPRERAARPAEAASRTPLPSLPREHAASPPGAASRTSVEDKLYRYLKQNADRTVGVAELRSSLWSSRAADPLKEISALQVNMSRLRRKLRLAGQGEDVVNERNRGYRLITTGPSGRS